MPGQQLQGPYPPPGGAMGQYYKVISVIETPERVKPGVLDLWFLQNVMTLLWIFAFSENLLFHLHTFAISFSLKLHHCGQKEHQHTMKLMTDDLSSKLSSNQLLKV